jgi:predicted deacylase
MGNKKLIIAKTEIKPGEVKEVDINIARLPSHTQIDTPIYISRSKEDGPVLALMAGMHGDEINGTEIVRRIIDSVTRHRYLHTYYKCIWFP